MKTRMKTRMKKAITFMLTMFILTAALPVNIQAKAVTTPVSQLPEKSDVGQITVTVNSENVQESILFSDSIKIHGKRRNTLICMDALFLL